MSKFCEKCKKSNRDTSKFCRCCGNTLMISPVITRVVLEPGVILENRYKILSQLHISEMSAVYKAMVIKLESPCVIKELSPGGTLQEQSETVDWLRREAKILAKLDHPSIPRVFDYFVNRGKYYLAMNFIDGIDAGTILEKEGKPGLPAEKVTFWATEILKVLDYLHNQDPPIIYRDLKPSNIMLHKDGRIVLIDFGIARMIRRDSDDDAPKTIIGTDGYAPLEQYQGKAEPRSDLYSLGATMHQFLTGIEPAPLGIEPLRELLPSVSPELDRVVTKALQEKPENRFSSAKDMLNALNSKSPPHSVIESSKKSENKETICKEDLELWEDRGFLNWGNLCRNIMFKSGFRGLYFIDLNNGWIVGDGGTILYGTKVGTEWVSQKSGTGKKIHSLYFIDEHTGWAVGEKGIILHTVNGGENWKIYKSKTELSLYGVHFTSEHTGWIAGEKGLVLKYESTGDKRWFPVKGGGEIWNTVNTQTTGDLYGIFFTSEKKGVIAGEGGTILYTGDGGNSWREKNVLKTIMKVFFVNSLKGWAAGESGIILHTEDGGINWNQNYLDPFAYLFDISFADPLNGWVAGAHLKKGNIILQTSDGGLTWKEQSIAQAKLLTGIYFLDIHNGWAVTSAGRIFHTNTGGESWKPQGIAVSC